MCESHWCSYVNMGRRPSLSSIERAHALGILQSGLTTRRVAAIFGVAYSTMSRLMIWCNATNSVKDCRWSGLPKATTHSQYNLIRTLTLRNRTITAKGLQGQLLTAVGFTVSDQTIRNLLHAAGLIARRPCCVYSSETTSQDTSFGLVPTSFGMEWASVVYSRIFRWISFQPLLQWRSDARLQTSLLTIFWRQRQRTWPLRRRVSNGMGCCHDAQRHSNSVHCRETGIHRLDWCRRHLGWNGLQWSIVAFSDESRFNLYFNDGRMRVYRRRC